MNARLILTGLLLVLAFPASALEFRSTARAALLYDSPSTAGTRVSIAGSGLPLEIIVELQTWAKVRDHNGRLAWIEKSALGLTKTVMIKADSSTIRLRPRPDAEVVFRAARGVLFELTGPIDGFGWLPVKHASGKTGWLPAHEAWGR